MMHSLPRSRSLRSAFYRITALLVLIPMVTLTTGCFGRFSLTKGVYGWNKSASDTEFVQTIVFWFAIPVYLITMILDSLFFNMIEFWTLGDVEEKGKEDSSVAYVPGRAGEAESPAAVEIYGAENLRVLTAPFPGGVTRSLLVARAAEREFRVLDPADGSTAVILIPGESGEIGMYSADGEFIRSLVRG